MTSHRTQTGWKLRNVNEPRFRLIAEATAEVLGLPLERVMAPYGSRCESHARQLAHLIAHQVTSRSRRDIAHYIGNVEESTVFHSVKVSERRIEADGEWRERHARILALVAERHAAEVAARPAELLGSVVMVPVAAGGVA